MTFIITCFNEEKNVIGAIKKVIKASNIMKISYEIIVYDDASSDNTFNVVEEYIEKNPSKPIKLFRNDINRGVAYVFVEASFRGKGKYCRLICGDDIDSLETHLQLIKNIGKADIIIPYYKEIIGRSKYRLIISKTFTKLVNFITGFSIKYYNGCPIYKRKDVMRWHVESTGLGYQAEFLVRLLREGKSYIEIALIGYDRDDSVSLRIRNILSVCHSLLKLFLGNLRVTVFK